jgi:hypothetical protein
MPTEIKIVTTDLMLVDLLLKQQDRVISVFNSDFSFVSWEGPKPPYAFHKIELRSIEPIKLR